MTRDTFRGLAGVYEAIEWLYSGGAIGAVKRDQYTAMHTGDRVCYAGVGAGGEVPGARARGTRLTLVDSSAAMLAKAAARVRDLPKAQVVHATVDAWSPPHPFDVLVTNFFLNSFTLERLLPVLDRLAGWVRPGGLWAVADFAPPQGLLARLYWSVPLHVVSPLTGEDRHPFYDYVPLLQTRGFTLTRQTHARIWGVGPRAYRGLFFEKRYEAFPT